ncbi:hypothetical protein [Parabacteroides timonensis]|uniref:hypothetical protein n=1 Tax=Parabacteroides timonensis TaxID=1871013 RepID=UPI00094F01A5|nr:hypothetical protein [Parabacteroides timonensis]
MANKEKIDYLLLDLKELETLIAGMRDAEVYPVSFFSQTFNLTHKILNDLHSLETAQIEMLREQMEAHQALIQSLPNPVAAPMPVAPEVKEKPVEEPVIIQEQEPKEAVREVIVEKKEIIIEEKETIQPTPIVKQPEASIPEPAVTVQPEPVPAPVVEPKAKTEVLHKSVTTEKQGVFLSDILEKKNLSDFRKAFSLNDRFRFRRELFGGNEEKMNKAITDLNDIHSYEESVTYLNNELKWNIEDEAVADFIKLLEKRFL